MDSGARVPRRPVCGRPHFLLDSLWDSVESEEDDDDIVTRYGRKISPHYARDAEEIAKSSAAEKP